MRPLGSQTRDGFRVARPGRGHLRGRSGLGSPSLRGLVACGLAGVRLVTSDAHPGLVDAIAATLPGAAGSAAAPTSLRNLLTRVPKAAQGLVATMVRSIFAQPDADSVFEQHRRIVRRSRTASPKPPCCSTRPPQILAPSPAFPKEHWRHPWSNNSLERLNKEIRRRTDVVGIFPDRAAIVRLAGALPAEQHDEWQVARRYMSADSIAKALAHPFTNPRRRSPSKQPPERQARMTRSASDTT